jgi:hypothetical protein
MRVNNKFAGRLSVLALAAIAGSAQAVGSFQEFTVSEGSVPGTPSNIFVADKGNGGYNEVLTVNADLTFDTRAYANFGQFYKNEGANLAGPSYINNFEPQGYGLYALFNSSGNVTGTGFSGDTGSLSLYIDPLQNTTLALGATGALPIVVGLDADDYLIASTSSPVSLVGIVGTPGAFDFLFKDFLLTTTDQSGAPGTQSGATYFTSPDPFHLLVRVNGDFDAFPFVPGPGNYSDITGDVSFVFAVPEPTALALLGVGLVGLGASRRRRVLPA